MSSEVLVSRPHYDDRAVAQGIPPQDPPVEPDVPHPSSGSAPAGYRSAKYSPAEWFSNYHNILKQAATEHNEAERVQRRSKALSQDSESDTQHTQAQGTRLLGDRLQDIHYWRSELQQHISQLQADIEALCGQKLRLERALDATEIPFAIATDNLTCRTRRPAPDLVHDTVEEELLKEVDLIKNIQALLRRTTAQVVSQIKLNKDTKQMLEMDWSDKYEAYNLDDTCGRYRNTSADTKHHPSSANMQDQVCNPVSWTKFTQDNLTKAMQEEHATYSLRMLVERVVEDTTRDMRVQCASVDQAFTQRCDELIQAKTQLENKHAQILEQIGAQERNIVALQQAIHDKEAPLRVVQSRLYVRSQRSNMELCRDPPQLSLETEEKQIHASVESLQQQLSQARGSLSFLEESRMAIEKDIACKANSLFIERDKCMTKRKRYPTMSTLYGY
ncbi:tektin-4 isoform X2 [Periophthalmus magnuspinnatus]|uniref:tektin-4 isoform X2 n=1 Tax=Periophthalmus magnuspinnatus TaxID=409849 RepID=UPI00145B056F|nr:tektin-4 isoform X2 [Periophthalmus magnuspinnatus]